MSEIHTEVDCEVIVRVVMQFDIEENRWHYYAKNTSTPKASGAELTVDQWRDMGLPIQQPDPED